MKKFIIVAVVGLIVNFAPSPQVHATGTGTSNNWLDCPKTSYFKDCMPYFAYWVSGTGSYNSGYFWCGFDPVQFSFCGAAAASSSGE